MASITLGAGITFGSGISSNDESTTPVLFSLDGSTFNGWGLSGSPTVDAVVGNPAPSYKITAANHFFRRNFGQTFHNKTITFDWRPTLRRPPSGSLGTTQYAHASHLLWSFGQLGTRPTTHEHPCTPAPATTISS